MVLNVDSMSCHVFCQCQCTCLTPCGEAAVVSRCLDVVLSTGTKTDHCFNKPCLLHGECISLPDRYECKCAAGYSGNNCEINNGENEI